MAEQKNRDDKNFKKILEKLEELEGNIENRIAEVEEQVRSFKWEFQEEVRIIKRSLKKLTTDYNTMSRALDNTLQETRRKVARIENHLKLPPLNQ